MKIHYITYATHSMGMFENLVNNKYNIEIKVLGWGTKWNGFLDKVKSILEYSKKVSKKDIIIYLDGFDTKIDKEPKNIEKLFKSFNCDILVSEHPIFINKYIMKKVFGEGKDGVIANAGLYMGYAYKIKELCEAILKKKTSDDQRALNLILDDFNLKIDTDNIIFKNDIYNKNKKTNALFISYPGGSNGTLHFKLSRYRRAIFEYGPFFKLEILFILIIIIVIIKYLYFK